MMLPSSVCVKVEGDTRNLFLPQNSIFYIVQKLYFGLIWQEKVDKVNSDV